MEKSLTPVAQYLRMSTDAQQLSLDSQAAVIRQYADSHGFTIVRSYEDPGKSGLLLKTRKGLGDLLHDVVSGDQPYKAVLVYDVSRWGRFQDTDEAAHYEFICRNAGIPLYYCAENFVNDGSPPNAIMKTLKRVMAGEYSRDLSLRTWRAKRIVAQRGFWPGGPAGYGLRRMLIDAQGRSKRILEPGDTNSLVGGRVILVPGPPSEVSTVRKIYSLTISGHSSKSIALEFNRKGMSCSGHPWHWWGVRAILSNPKYVGSLICGRTTGILGAKRVRVPRDQWTMKTGAFAAIVGIDTFETAQRVIRNRTANKTDEELLDALRSLLVSKGRLSNQLVDKSAGVPAVRTYRGRFGSMERTCQLIDYRRLGNIDPKMIKARVKSRKETEQLRRQLMRTIRQTFHHEVRVIRSPPGQGRPILCFEEGIRIPMLVCRCLKTAGGQNRWVVPRVAPEQGPLTLLCRCTPNNENILDCHLVPSFRTRRGLRLVQQDPWLKQGKKLRNDLTRLHSLARSFTGTP